MTANDTETHLTRKLARGRGTVKAIFPPHLHAHKLSCHGLTMTKKPCSGMSFLSLAMRSDGTKAASHMPTGLRERKRGKAQPSWGKPAQVAKLAAMALAGRETQLASQQRMMKTP